MTSLRSLFIPFTAAAVLAGCATTPTGPAVMVLPGTQKSMDQFRVDEGDCRLYAQSLVGPNSAQAANDAAVGNTVAASAIGAAVGAIIGSASGQSGAGAAIGAGSGLLLGSASGANASGYSSYQLQRNYDAAYMQCMYARGNQVPGRVAYRGPGYGYGAGGYYPPPNAAAPPAAPSGYYPPPNAAPPVAPSGYYPASPSYPPPNYPAPVNAPAPQG